MRVFIVIFLLIIFSNFKATAQYELVKDDSLVNLLTHKYATISEDKIAAAYELITRNLPSRPIYDSVINVLISEAETSRNRLLMCAAYNRAAQAYLNYFSRQEYCEKAKPYIDQCLSISNESNLDIYKAASFMQYAAYYRSTAQKQKALDYNNQAIALAISIGNDSLLCESYTSIAVTWDALANKLSRFQALLNAREFAEKAGKQNLLCRNYINLAAFYKETEQYEKCKDYYTLAIDKGREWQQWHIVLSAMRGMGQTYAAEKNNALVMVWYNQAQSIADSLQLKNEKLSLNLDLLNYYLNNETSATALAYLNSHPEIMKFINDYGIGYQLNKLYAADKQQLKQFDSALYYMNIAAPFEYKQLHNYGEKYNFTMQWALILKAMGKNEAVKQKLLFAKNFADSAGDLEIFQDISQQLDSAYLATGDYKNAFIYYSRYNFYKDTLDALGRQKDLLNVEIDNTNKRAEHQKLQEAALLRQRNNLQYMGITAAIATIFILLVLLGMFRMSPAIIKALGFFAFIFLFEFITLLLDTQIQEITHDEPWKILAIKIVLIAILLPLHHRLEEKVLHYLTSKAHELKPVFRFHKTSPENVS